MSELNFFMAPEDTAVFAGWLSEQFGCTFVADDSTTWSNAPDLSVALEALDFPPLVHVLSSAWSSWPLYFDETADGRKFCRQRYGGPAFLWNPCNRLGENRDVLVVGFFGDWPFYYIRPGSHESVPRPDAMSEAFQSARRWLRHNCRRSHRQRDGSPGPWVAPHAASDFTLRWGDDLYELA